MKHLVIVGGGISGLAAAQGARDQAGPADLRITVLEREEAVGGKARTVVEDGWRIETGPTGFLDAEPALDRLIHPTGLPKLAASDHAARRFVVRGGRLRELPTHPLRFATAGILGPLGLLRILREPWIRPRRDPEDESVWEFAARRLGRQAAERLIAPMVLGVFAGDARRLSLPAAFPKMAALEREHGSLIRGMLALRKAGRAHGGPGGPAGRLTSFAKGLEQLPAALAATGQFEVHCQSTVEHLRRRPGGGYTLSIAGAADVHADAVVLAGEPWAMAPLLRDVQAAAADELAGIDCPPVAVVALGYDARAHERVPRGFGALIPRGEGYRILGCLWDTHLFPGRSAPDRLLMRVMLGGAMDPEVGTLSGDELCRIARDDVRRLFGGNLAPVYERAFLWPRAIPQYELGHLDRVRRFEHALTRAPGLFLGGNGLHGVAFGRSAATGMAAGERAVAWLQQHVESGSS